MKRTILLMVLFVGAAVVSATEINYDSPGKWTNLLSRKKYQPEAKEGGVLAVSGSRYIYSEPAVPVDQEKKYRITGSFRQAGSEPASIYFGLAFYDEKGRYFDLANSNAVPNSDTELTATAKKGDTTLKIKNGTGWQKFKGTVIALNTAPDYSDLPNFNLIRIPIQSVTEAGGVWIVTLSKPLPADIPAGTALRLHSPGGTFYAAANRKLRKRWLVFESKVLSGITRGRGIGDKGMFPRGTAAFRILIITRSGPKKENAVEFKDVKIIEE